MKDPKTNLTRLSIVTLSNNHVSCSLGEGMAILNIVSHKRFILDAIGERIWEMLNQPVRIKIIIKELTTTYDVPYEQCEKDTIFLLNRLNEAGLITMVRKK